MLFLLLACNGDDKINLDDTSTPSEESGTDSEDSTPLESIPTDDSGSDDSGPDDSEPPVDGTELTFLIGPNYSGLTLTTTALFFDAEGAAYLGDARESAEITASELTVTFGIPPIADAIPYDNATTIYIYLVALHEDNDGDGFLSGRELLSGVAPTWLVYVEGPPPPDLPGFAEGWNAYNPTGVLIANNAIPAPPNLIPVDDIAFGGSYAGDPDEMGLVMIPQTEVFPTSLLLDGPFENPYEAEISGPPPVDHLMDLGGGVWGALEFMIFYQDVDRSGGISETDVATDVVCNHDGNPVGLYYIEPFSDILNGYYYASEGLTPGWMGIVSLPDGSGDLADAAMLSDLTSCPADF